MNTQKFFGESQYFLGMSSNSLKTANGGRGHTEPLILFSTLFPMYVTKDKRVKKPTSRL